MSALRTATLASRSTLNSCLRIHPDDLPDMAVEIVKAPSKHESVIHRRPGFDCARTHGRINDFIDLILAFLRQADKHLRRLLGVGNWLAGELLEFLFRQEHRVNILGDHHTGRGCVGELRIERIAKLPKKCLGSIEILDRQVHENLGGHFYLQGSPDEPTGACASRCPKSLTVWIAVGPADDGSGFFEAN